MYASETEAQEEVDPALQQQALSHFNRLAHIYGISLMSSQQEVVSKQCQGLLSTTLQGISDDWGRRRQKYNKLLTTIESSLGLVTDDLRHMGEDGSAIDLASLQFTEVEREFSVSANAYERILQDLLTLESSCQHYPLATVAGLYEFNIRRRAVQTAATELLSFTELELNEAMIVTQKRLIHLESE